MLEPGPHLLCLALVAADLLARALRIQWLLGGLSCRITLLEAFRLNAYGDAACAVTPLRIGGEPARLAGMLAARVPASAGFVAISLEVLAAWPVIITAVVTVFLLFGRDWWATASPALASAAASGWPWVVALVMVSVVAWLVARRWIRRPSARMIRRPLRRVAVYWRRMPALPLLASVPMTLVNVASRAGLLVVLAQALPQPPALAPLVVGSFVLIYSQLFLPTPSGAGVVDLGFLSGAAGDLGPAEASLLFWWRFYTSGVGILLGAMLFLQARASRRQIRYISPQPSDTMSREELHQS
jgi:uncharacterized membrane protein YbhN (UPF0104 family)